MKKYTLIAIQHFSGAEPIAIGEEIKNLSPLQVEKYLISESASFKTKKELTAFTTELEAFKKEALEDEAKVKSILEKSKIQNELNELYLATILKEAELDGEVLSDDEILAAVESIAKRDAMDKKKANGN